MKSFRDVLRLYSTSSSTASFPTSVLDRCTYLTSCLHPARLCVSSPDSPFSLKSSVTLSIHLHFGLPFLLLPSTSTVITLFPTLFFIPSRDMSVPLYSYIILNFFVRPQISAKSFSFCILFLSSAVLGYDMCCFGEELCISVHWIYI